jgi:hypothetical protein
MNQQDKCLAGVGGPLQAAQHGAAVAPDDLRHLGPVRHDVVHLGHGHQAPILPQVLDDAVLLGADGQQLRKAGGQQVLLERDGQGAGVPVELGLAFPASGRQSLGDLDEVGHEGSLGQGYRKAAIAR